MARVYKVTLSKVAVTAAQDLFVIKPLTNHPVMLLGIEIDQSSDKGDSEEEFLPYLITRGYTVSGLSGTSVTPAPDDPGDSAAGFSAFTNCLALGISGSSVNLWAGAFNIRSGLALWFPPEAVPVAHQGNTSIVVRLVDAPADSLTMSATLVVAET